MTDVTDEQRRDPAQWARLLSEVGEYILVERADGADHELTVSLTCEGALDGAYYVAPSATTDLMRAVLAALEMRRAER